jgi:hypothetical protein
MTRIDTLDYLTELLLSIIDLDESILNSVDYTDSLIQRDALLSVWDAVDDSDIPELTDIEAETLELLIVYMTELNYSVDELIEKREYIQRYSWKDSNK